VLDAAYWVKGCSSLGRLRFAVLLGVGKRLNDGGALCLMDTRLKDKLARRKQQMQHLREMEIAVQAARSADLADRSSTTLDRTVCVVLVPSAMPDKL
jgi:uncharacterized protein (DUF2252 family)